MPEPIPEPPSPTIDQQPLVRSIRAVNTNVARLVDDADDLFTADRFPSAYALAVLAQEEAAKVYLLDLVRSGSVPFNEGIQRALRDHPCKQLLAMILDYMATKSDEVFERTARSISEDDWKIPDRVKSALNLFRYEKVQSFIDGYQFTWDADPQYDPSAVRVAEGKLDKLKQSAFYVALGRNGQLASEPHHVISGELAERELDRAKRLMWAVRWLDEGRTGLWNYEEIRKLFFMLFTDVETLRKLGLISD